MTEVDECASVSVAGDIGDRSLRRSWGSWSRRMVPVDNLLESGSVDGASIVPVLDETSAIPAGDNEIEKERAEPNFVKLNYISRLMWLALPGILGLITRIYLQKLFGPKVIGATSKQSYMYLDLPPNMVGSVLMGWCVVFKGPISQVSENLAVGLTTGFLGSLTTFSGWNEASLELSAQGRWVFAVLAIVIGLFLAAFSIILGYRLPKVFNTGYGTDIQTWRAMLLDGIFVIRDFKSATNGAEFPFAVLVGPFGVWIRWLLARRNGRGIGKAGKLKWLPFGTLMANVAAASIMAALAIIKKAVNNHECDVVATGMQLGFCGCLSTVSTFIAEFNALSESSHPMRAYVYALSTIMISFALGTLIYSIPFWVKNYE